MTNPVIGTPWQKLDRPVSEEAIEGMDKYWRVANYMSIGQIYLRSNPLMKEPFTRDDVKHRLVGHWGTTPGLNFLLAHINRLIADHQQNTVFIMGPWPRRPCRYRSVLHRRHLHRVLPEHHQGRSWPAEVLPPVLLPGWHSFPLRSGDAGLHPRRRRAGLRPVARLRRDHGQPEPLRPVHHR